MRWDSLFDDLEAQLERGRDEDESALRADEERLRLRRLTLRDRMRAASRNGEVVVLRVASGAVLRVQPSAFGADWVCGELMSGSVPESVIVPLRAVQSISLHPVAAATATTSVPADHSDRFGLAVVLGDLCRRRVDVRVTTTAGELHGTIDRVGADHLDLAVHEPGVARRAAEVRSVELVAFEAIVAVVC